jgi:hypothetical protein
LIAPAQPSRRAIGIAPDQDFYNPTPPKFWNMPTKKLKAILRYFFHAKPGIPSAGTVELAELNFDFTQNNPALLHEADFHLQKQRLYSLSSHAQTSLHDLLWWQWIPLPTTGEWWQLGLAFHPLHGSGQLYYRPSPGDFSLPACSHLP